MKKILFLSPLPPPHYGSAMSSEECLNILKNTSKFKINNIQLNYSKDMSDVGTINFQKIKGILEVARKIIKTRKEKLDFIYFMPGLVGLGLYRDSFFIFLCKLFLRKKMIFHIRERITEEQWENKFWRFLYKLNFRNSRVIVLDERLKQDLHGIIEDEKIYVLPNAIKNIVSSSKIKKIINKRKQQNSFNILFYSNMDKAKGWPKVLDACRILHNKKIDFQCKFIGAWISNKDKKEFDKFIKKNGLQEKAFSVGRKTGKERDKIIETSDILVFPTEYKPETFGRVIIEGMMFGLPVIANGIAAIPTIIQHGKTGFVLKHNTGEEIAGYMEKLKNRRLRERMGALGRKRFLKEYEIKNYSKKFIGILNKV